MDVTDLDADPLQQFSGWLEAARGAGEPMPEAMTVATATADGAPSARMVILRSLNRGLAFFTDDASDKGVELAANPRAAAVFHWLVPAHRQVRVAGPVERVSEEEADQYWGTRPLAARLSAAASHQSSVIANRAVLKTRTQDLRRRYPPRPSPSGALGRLSGAAVPRRVLAGVAGRPPRPDPLPPPRQWLGDRAVVAVNALTQRRT